MAKKPGSKRGAKKYRIELTSLSIFLWGVCLFFLLAWIFVLGILVGRGFLPGAVTAISDLKGQFSKLPGMVGNNESYDLRSSKKSAPDPKLAFYEKLSSKKDEAKGEGLARKEVKRPRKEPTQKQIKVSPKTSLEAQKREGAGSLKKEPEPPSAAIQYTVQLASLEEKNKAEKMINQLIDRGFAAYFYKVKVKGKTYYRVRCGRFTSKREAIDYAKRIEVEEGIKGFVSRIE